MHNRRKLVVMMAGSALLTSSAPCQVADLLNAYQAADRAMGMGGSLDATDSNTQSAYYNPAALGFLDRAEVGIGYSNLPSSTTGISNSRSDPKYFTIGHSGSLKVTNFGYATPFRDLFKGGRGTLGISYTVGGFIDDTAFGPQAGLPDGSLTLLNYVLRRSAETDFYTLGYGASNTKQTASFGVGLTYASQKVTYVETGTAQDSGGNQTPFQGANSSFTGSGVGVLIGGQIVPSGTPNASFGLSYRSQIHLSNAGPGGIYDTIPARLLAGASYRKDNLGKGDDYLLFGAQLQYFFAGNASVAFDRKSQTVFGTGVEYNHSFSTWRLPIRLGYQSLGSGGNGFASRNAFTYGIGYRPGQGNYSIDLDWAAPEGGGRDFGISAAYRFK